MIKEGQLAKLKLILEDGSEQEWECVTDKIEEDRISLIVPRDNPEFTKYFQEGAEIAVSVYSQEGIIAFDSIIMDSAPDSDFIIEFSGEYTKIQRRKHIRAYLETKLVIERLTGQNQITSTVDIGGASIKFVYDGQFRINEWVNSRLYLPFQTVSIRAAGTIVKKPHLLPNEYILLFNQIRDDDRQQIIDKCLDLQTFDINLDRIE